MVGAGWAVGYVVNIVGIAFLDLLKILLFWHGFGTVAPRLLHYY
jgi:hypothetical protein